MKKTLFLTALLCVIFFGNVMAQDANTIFTKDGKPLEVRTTPMNTLIELNKADSIFKFNIAVANFPAGKKLDWHYHPDGQILVYTDGIGYYQERGKPKRVVQKGEVIKCMPGVEHWHGASAESGASYMATNSVLKGATVWLEKVSDEDYNSNNSITKSKMTMEQEITQLSKDKWQWMADKDVDKLGKLFDNQAMFVHMGGSWGKERELEIIKSGFIHYKKADIHEVLSPIVMGNTVILLNRITLTAVVANNEVSNPFMVTEVYVKVGNEWKMGSLSFSKLMTPP
jgi:quercetin dioxygenase-like cupin family protein